MRRQKTISERLLILESELDEEVGKDDNINTELAKDDKDNKYSLSGAGGLLAQVLGIKMIYSLNDAGITDLKKGDVAMATHGQQSEDLAFKLKDGSEVSIEVKAPGGQFSSVDGEWTKARVQAKLEEDDGIIFTNGNSTKAGFLYFDDKMKDIAEHWETFGIATYKKSASKVAKAITDARSSSKSGNNYKITVAGGTASATGGGKIAKGIVPTTFTEIEVDGMSFTGAQLNAEVVYQYVSTQEPQQIARTNLAGAIGKSEAQILALQTSFNNEGHSALPCVWVKSKGYVYPYLPPMAPIADNEDDAKSANSEDMEDVIEFEGLYTDVGNPIYRSGGSADKFRERALRALAWAKHIKDNWSSYGGTGFKDFEAYTGSTLEDDAEGTKEEAEETANDQDALSEIDDATDGGLAGHEPGAWAGADLNLDGLTNAKLMKMLKDAKVKGRSKSYGNKSKMKKALVAWVRQSEENYKKAIALGWKVLTKDEKIEAIATGDITLSDAKKRGVKKLRGDLWSQISELGGKTTLSAAEWKKVQDAAASLKLKWKGKNSKGQAKDPSADNWMNYDSNDKVNKRDTWMYVIDENAKRNKYSLKKYLFEGEDSIPADPESSSENAEEIAAVAGTDDPTAAEGTKEDKVANSIESGDLEVSQDLANDIMDSIVDSPNIEDIFDELGIDPEAEV